MKKFTLLLLSLFFALGTSVAQDNGEENAEFALQYMNPADGKSAFEVNYIQFQFNKEIVVTLPDGGIDVKNTTTGDVTKITRIMENPYLEKSIVIFLFEQKTEIGKDGKEETVDQYIKDEGDYSYTIPAGCIKSVDGEDFGEHTFTFKITSPLAIESIAPNTTTSLEKIELTFNKAISRVEMPASGLVVVDNYWTPVSNIKNEVTFSDDRKTVTLELEKPITTPGNYNLDINNGVFVGEDGGINEYASLLFTVIDPTPSFSTNYNEGDRVKEITDLEITFRNVNEVKLVEGADPVTVYMPGDGEATGTATLADNKITVTFDQEFTEEGVYTFSIPAGMFTMDGAENEEYSVSVELYTFVVTPLEVISVTPVAGTVTQIDKIVIKYNQLVTLAMDENWQTVSYQINLTSKDKQYTLTYAPSSYNTTDVVEYLVNAQWNGYDAYESEPVTEIGEYSIDLSDIIVNYASESFIDEWGYPDTRWHGKNGYCEGIYTWVIEDTGICEVTKEDEDTKAIFDLQGRKVENPTKGIYIINGKKSVVK